MLNSPWHGNIKCNCGHTQKDHSGGWGWCHDSKHPKAGKCGCTWYHPNDEYLKNNKKKAKLAIAKFKKEQAARRRKIRTAWRKFLKEKYG